MIKTKAIVLKLLSFVSLFGTTLWTGSWSSGSLLVPNTDKYKAFILMQAGQSILAIKRATSLYVDGYTIIGSSSGTQYIKTFSAAINGNTWTYRWANEIAHNASGSHGAPKVNEEITQIIGFIPDLGGVLLNSIFKAFSHLQKIGGGVNAGYQEVTCEGFAYRLGLVNAHISKWYSQVQNHTRFCLYTGEWSDGADKRMDGFVHHTASNKTTKSVICERRMWVLCKKLSDNVYKRIWDFKDFIRCNSDKQWIRNYHLSVDRLTTLERGWVAC